MNNQQNYKNQKRTFNLGSSKSMKKNLFKLTPAQLASDNAALELELAKTRQEEEIKAAEMRLRAVIRAKGILIRYEDSFIEFVCRLLAEHQVRVFCKIFF